MVKSLPCANIDTFTLASFGRYTWQAITYVVWAYRISA